MEIFSGWHVALYVAPFSGAYKAMEAADLVLQDHPYFDKVHSMEEALKFHQFRFRVMLFPELTLALKPMYNKHLLLLGPHVSS